MTDTQLAEQLLQKIAGREVRVGVIGLGYVGLPLCLTFAEKRIRVLGLDIDAAKVEDLRQRRSYIQNIPSGRVADAIGSGTFEVSTDFQRLSEVDCVLVCVPTPLTPQREPDIHYIVETGHEIRKRLKRGQLIVLESTTYPGTTDELLFEILEQSGLRCDKDYFLAFSPEREDPGNAQFTTSTIPKVVGGVTPTSGRLAAALYGSIIDKVVPLSSSRAAEATKLTENIFRAVNIALVNELKIVYDRMGIDIWEVLDAAATKPFGFMRFNPGPGLGGHCVPLDPFYLTWKAREYGVQPKFIELAGEVNTAMPDYVMSKLTHALNDRSKPLRGSRVMVLGLAYKKNVDDLRESPAWILLNRLLELGCQVAYHDPHVPRTRRTRHYENAPELESTPLTPENLKKQDAVLLVTDHTAVDYELVAAHAPLIVDTRGVYRQPRANVVKA